MKWEVRVFVPEKYGENVLYRKVVDSYGEGARAIYRLVLSPIDLISIPDGTIGATLSVFNEQNEFRTWLNLIGKVREIGESVKIVWKMDGSPKPQDKNRVRNLTNPIWREEAKNAV